MSTVITIPATAITANVEKHGAARTVPASLTGVKIQMDDTNGMWGSTTDPVARAAAGLPVGSVKQWGVQCSKDGGANWSWGPVFQGDPNDSTTWLAFGLLGRNGLPPGLVIGSDIVNNAGDQLRLAILTDAGITLGATITTSP